MFFVNIGFGNIIQADRIVAMITPDSAPAKRMETSSLCPSPFRSHTRKSVQSVVSRASGCQFTRE